MLKWFTFEVEVSTSSISPAEFASSRREKRTKLVVEGFSKPSFQDTTKVKLQPKGEKRKKGENTLGVRIRSSSGEKNDTRRSTFELKFEKTTKQPAKIAVNTSTSLVNHSSSRGNNTVVHQYRSEHDEFLKAPANNNLRSSRFAVLHGSHELMEKRGSLSPSLRRLLTLIESLQERSATTTFRRQGESQLSKQYYLRIIHAEQEDIGKNMHQNPSHHRQRTTQDLEISLESMSLNNNEKGKLDSKGKRTVTTAQTEDMSVVYVPVAKKNPREDDDVGRKKEKYMFNGPPPPVWRPIPHFPLPSSPRSLSSSSNQSESANSIVNPRPSVLNARYTGGEGVIKKRIASVLKRDEVSNELKKSLEFNRKLDDDENKRKEENMKVWKEKPERYGASTSRPKNVSIGGSLGNKKNTLLQKLNTARKSTALSKDDENDNALLDGIIGLRPTLHRVDFDENGRVKVPKYGGFKNGSWADEEESRRSGLKTEMMDYGKEKGDAEEDRKDGCDTLESKY